MRPKNGASNLGELVMCRHRQARSLPPPYIFRDFCPPPPISFMFRYPDQQFGIGCYLHDILFLPSLLFTSCVGFLGGGRTLFDFRCARSLWTSESLSSSQERCHIFLSSNQQCPNFLATIFNEFTSFFYVVCRY